MRFRLDPLSSTGVSVEPDVQPTKQTRVVQGHGYIGTGVRRIVAGSNITVDSTNPEAPIVSSTGGGGSGTTRSITVTSSNTAAGSTANTDYVYIVSSGNPTITLPTAVLNTNRYTVTNSGTGTPTVATTGGQTIIGSSTATLPIQNMSLEFISNGSNWVIE